MLQAFNKKQCCILFALFIYCAPPCSAGNGCSSMNARAHAYEPSPVLQLAPELIESARLVRTEDFEKLQDLLATDSLQPEVKKLICLQLLAHPHISKLPEQLLQQLDLPLENPSNFFTPVESFPRTQILEDMHSAKNAAQAFAFIKTSDCSKILLHTTLCGRISLLRAYQVAQSLSSKNKDFYAAMIDLLHRATAYDVWCVDQLPLPFIQQGNNYSVDIYALFGCRISYQGKNYRISEQRGIAILRLLVNYQILPSNMLVDLSYIQEESSHSAKYGSSYVTLRQAVECRAHASENSALWKKLLNLCIQRNYPAEILGMEQFTEIRESSINYSATWANIRNELASRRMPAEEAASQAIQDWQVAQANPE